MQRMHDESSFIQLMRERDPGGLKGIMEIYKDYVYTLLHSMLRSSVDAEEAAQDTFIKVFRSIAQFNGSSKFSTWLYRIAYRTGLDYLKKRRRFESIDAAAISEKYIAIDAEGLKSIQNAELTNYLHEALNKLKPEDAAIVRLFYLKELSLREIADVTTMSESNIKVRLFRARKTLRKITKENIHKYTLST